MKNIICKQQGFNSDFPFIISLLERAIDKNDLIESAEQEANFYDLFLTYDDNSIDMYEKNKSIPAKLHIDFQF